MKMIKRLTKANCGDYGIKFVSEEDGYRKFEYKGIPLLQEYSAKYGTVDIFIDVYELDGNFIVADFLDTEESKLCNYVRDHKGEFDIDTFSNYLEKIYLKIKELNETAHTTEEQEEYTKQMIRKEIKETESFIEKVKEKLKWWECSEYDLKEIRKDYNYWDSIVDDGKFILQTFDQYSIKRKKELISSAYRGRVLRKISEYDIKRVNKYIS